MFEKSIIKIFIISALLTLSVCVQYGSTAAAGKTTRYWDCCKPSCAWRGNIFGNKNPVRSCKKDGATTQNENTQSGCNNGDAFVCNNQKPIVINNQLAYGFAAAALQGQSQLDYCCACYKLDFNSGPVAGKSMIVQVTNTGGDLGGNHFDLQIPGGGVGIFNGCSKQWGAPANGWGQRYGGVTSRDQCNQLPTQIRDGCFFRFDWFKNADNPTMTFNKVNCPSQLTAITGCSRP